MPGGTGPGRHARQILRPCHSRPAAGSHHRGRAGTASAHQPACSNPVHANEH